MLSMAGGQSQEEREPGQRQVVLLSERALPDRRPRKAAEPAPPPVSSPLPPQLTDLTRREIQLAGTVGFLRGVAALLAIRWILMLASGGAFALAYIARDWLGFALFVAYCSLVIVPLILLDYTTRRGKS